ncbi:MAG: ADP-ribosylglycohydrolase family protein [Verrucomicrobiales bacterium]|jgi:ADP-ribosyl-[dinitrogen reductase] hydrolase|nr:ADP-ribosylglycohydrolase family protein [Verrucomicrobiales bacterium]MDP4792503.1 ADP-ribosylglycohydrolase family protein [Verrucomicrobiales bacterium]
MNSPFNNSYWLEPGRILCGEYPRDFDDVEDHEGMSAILDAGVRVFIDLTEEGELKPYREIALTTAASLGLDPDTLEFHRHPIRDLSVPRSPAEMRAVLATIRYARHRALPLYLHCWGGRGRTGTVAGCALRDLFSLDGDEALARLTERWQDCAKSAHSESPETHEQREYVRGFNPVAFLRVALYHAALIGAAVGDALGVPVEFAGRAARINDPVTGMRAFGTHHQPAGTWSDDTSMILATITGLLKAGDYDGDAVMKEFVQWFVAAKHTPHGEVFDIGGATRAAIRSYESGVPALECGGESESSNGNGSLMRILPIALAAADEPDLVELASTFSSLTHAHERSRFCCAFFCLVVSELTHGQPLREATLFAWEVMDRRWTFSPGERHRFEKLHPDSLFDREEEEIGSSGHVIDTLEAALWVNAQHGDYAAAVLHAVNLGDDTDTTGCVAGALAGILHGIAGIPAEWRETLVKADMLELAATEFAGFAPRKK